MRSSRVVGVLLGLALAGLVGCEASPFRCGPSHGNNSCAVGQACSVDGYCTVASATCPGGRAYSSSAASPGACATLPDAGSDVPTVDVPMIEDLGSDVIDASPVDTGLDASVDAPSDTGTDVATDEGDVPVDAGRTTFVLNRLTEDTSCRATRLILPLSGERVSQQRPNFQASFEGSLAGVTVELSQSRNFDNESGIVRIGLNAIFQTQRPEPQLAPGVWFWRAARVCTTGSTSTRSAITPVWEVVIPNRMVTNIFVPNTRWPGLADYNGDGHADLAVADPTRGVVSSYTAQLAEGTNTTAPTNTNAATGPGASGATMDSGDIDGDGFVDLVVGACARASESRLNEAGRDQTSCERVVRVYRGGPAGLIATPSYTITAPSNAQLADGSRFASSVAVVGDINRDGYADIAVGSSQGTAASPVLLYLGSATGPEVIAPRRFQPGSTSPGFGFTVAAAGDVDSDNNADFLVSSPMEGRVWIVYGMSPLPADMPAWSAASRTGSTTALVGMAIGPAGDADGDGYGDVLITASGSNSVFVVRGGNARLSSGDLGAAAHVLAVANHSIASVAGGIDVNRDGLSDVVIGVANPSTMQTNGAVWVLRGSVQPDNATFSYGTPVRINAPGGLYPTEARFGMAVSAGDYNRDGFDDIAVGGPGITRNDGAARTPAPVTVVFGGAMLAGNNTTPTALTTGSLAAPLNAVTVPSSFGRTLR